MERIVQVGACKARCHKPDPDTRRRWYLTQCWARGVWAGNFAGYGGRDAADVLMYTQSSLLLSRRCC